MKHLQHNEELHPNTNNMCDILQETRLMNSSEICQNIHLFWEMLAFSLLSRSQA